MITNERQYGITKKKVERFARALEEFEAKAGERADVSPRLIRAERDGMEAQLAVLRKEVEEYERVRDEGVSGLVFTSIDELAKWLIWARIGSRMTQRELAARLHVQEQQIQRYEAERYASASYRRLCEVAHVLGVGSQTRFFVQPGRDHGKLEEAREAGGDRTLAASDSAS